MKLRITMETVLQQARMLAAKLASTRPGAALRMYGIPRGGIPAALAVHVFLKDSVIVDDPLLADVFIDDILDSGATAKRFHEAYGKATFALFNKMHEPWTGKWLELPWEHIGDEDRSATDIVTRLLQYIGEDPQREGLRDTPTRVLGAWREWATGYDQNAADILKSFEDGADGCNELVIVHNMPFISKCEHHLADMTGIAHVGYIPRGKIVGLSKLARLVEMFARRLQVQERATNQIADALMANLDPIGAGVLVRASHACMSTRGVRIHGSVTTTSAMRGALLDVGNARKEFLDLCAMAERQS